MAVGPVRDIIVGGAGDRLFGCARRYADLLAAEHPKRDVLYLPQCRRRHLLSLLNTGAPLNLIGHSWGAADVAWALGRAGPRARPQLVIGVDPVGKPLRQGCGAGLQTLTVYATGSEGRLMDGNVTARLGRWLGRPCPPGFDAECALSYDTPYAHYDMTRMMRHPGPDGRSAEDCLLDG
ncbi:MAG: hypothetical protein AAF311_11145 [Pseudomonadota bacterium]